MAKTKKRTVTCSKCNETGHNARTCSKETTKSAVAVKVTPPELFKKLINEKPPVKKRPRRPAPTQDTGTAATSAPYRCTKCNNVAILVIVKIKDHMASHRQKKEVFVGDLRCELCMNKPSPSDLILKWGATPGETVPVPGQDA